MTTPEFLGACTLVCLVKLASQLTAVLHQNFISISRARVRVCVRRRARVGPRAEVPASAKG